MPVAQGLDGYNLLAAQVQALFADERDFIANAAQFSAFLYNQVDDLNWAGFYLNRNEELVLGPVPGPGGVRAHSVRQGRVRRGGGHRQTQRVEDVHAFPGISPVTARRTASW
jgi:GAF domain-containing protein